MKRFSFLLLIALAIGACYTAPEQKPTSTESKPKIEEKKDPVAGDKSAEMTPTETVKAFIEAYRGKDVKAMKTLLSKKSLEILQESAKVENQTLDQRLEAFMKAEELPFKGVPEMRNEKIDGDKATVEVNVDGKWEKTPVVKEDGRWKFSMTE